MSFGVALRRPTCGAPNRAPAAGGIATPPEETFVVLAGALTIYIGEPAERVDVPVGGAVTVPGGVARQSANHGDDDLLVYGYGYPPDDGAEALDPVV